MEWFYRLYVIDYSDYYYWQFYLDIYWTTSVQWALSDWKSICHIVTTDWSSYCGAKNRWESVSHSFTFSCRLSISKQQCLFFYTCCIDEHGTRLRQRLLLLWGKQLNDVILTDVWILDIDEDHFSLVQVKYIVHKPSIQYIHRWPGA